MKKLMLAGCVAMSMMLWSETVQAAEVSPLKAWTYYRFNITKVTGTECLQIAEIALYDKDGNRINLNLTNMGNGGVSRLTGSSTCSLLENGAAGAATDSDLGTHKFFDGNLDTKGMVWAVSKITDDDESTWPAVIMRLADNAPAVAAYNLATANDNVWSETTNGRTVTGWSLDASDDGVNWVRLDRQVSPASAVPSPITDKTWYNGGKAMPTTDYSGVQYFVGAGNVLSVSRNTMLQPVINNGTMSIAAGATASMNIAENDVGLQPGGELSGSGTLEKQGEGELRIGGNNRTFAGKIAAKGGTVRFVDTHPLHAYAYYRLMLRKKYSGNTNGNFELGELALYDANGERINLNLTNKGNSQSVGSLTASSFSYIENGSWAHGSGNNEAPEKLFDGNLTTKMYSGNFTPTATKCPYVLMRLADDAPAVAAYKLGTGNDVKGCPDRQIVSWSLEGSDDGATWTELHSVTDDSHTELANSIWFNGGNAYPVMVCQGGCKAKYYRFSVTGLHACEGYEGLQFSELALFDAQGNRVNLNLTYKGEDIDLANLGEREATFIKNGHSLGAENERTDKLFDGNASTKGYFNGTTYGEDKAVQIVMRLADSAAAVAGYNICTGDDDVYSYDNKRCRTMGSWKLEASDDGTNWTTLTGNNDSSYSIIANKTWFNQGTAIPCAVSVGDGDGSSAPIAATLSVAAGARMILPTNQGTGISGLEIDCTAAASTIENFTAASAMTLNLVNFTDFRKQHIAQQKIELPISFAGTVALGDMSGWTIMHDGVQVSGYGLTFEGGRLYVILPGMLIIVK